MNATALTITIFYLLVFGGLIIAYSAWWITRKKEDHIWRWIFTFLGGMIFATFFWVAYFLGAHGAAWLVWLLLFGCMAWFYIVLSVRTKSNMTRSVFAFFGAVVVGMCAYGGYTSGVRGWWGMAIPYYVVVLHTIYSLIATE